MTRITRKPGKRVNRPPNAIQREGVGPADPIRSQARNSADPTRRQGGDPAKVDLLQRDVESAAISLDQAFLGRPKAKEARGGVGITADGGPFPRRELRPKILKVERFYNFQIDAHPSTGIEDANNPVPGVRDIKIRRLGKPGSILRGVPEAAEIV